MSKYDPLGSALAARPETAVSLSIAEINAMVPGGLPHRPQALSTRASGRTRETTAGMSKRACGAMPGSVWIRWTSLGDWLSFDASR